MSLFESNLSSSCFIKKKKKKKTFKQPSQLLILKAILHLINLFSVLRLAARNAWQLQMKLFFIAGAADIRTRIQQFNRSGNRSTIR